MAKKDWKNTVNWIALILVIVGGLNWGLVGLMNFNLVTALFGSWPLLVTIVYDLVGLSALWMIYYAYAMK
jgi:uncharacterized membrane protein YuzA (DUF378 family)